MNHIAQIWKVCKDLPELKLNALSTCTIRCDGRVALIHGERIKIRILQELYKNKKKEGGEQRSVQLGAHEGMHCGSAVKMSTLGWCCSWYARDCFNIPKTMYSFKGTMQPERTECNVINCHGTPSQSAQRASWEWAPWYRSWCSDPGLRSLHCRCICRYRKEGVRVHSSDRGVVTKLSQIRDEWNVGQLIAYP